jgi:hypothetical protein
VLQTDQGKAKSFRLEIRSWKNAHLGVFYLFDESLIYHLKDALMDIAPIKLLRLH